MPMPNAKQFVQDFPEFGDILVFPVEQINYWLDVAGMMLTARWDDTYTGRDPDNTKTLLYLGAELYVAHNIAIQSRDMIAGSKGGGVGFASSTGVGAVSAKSVGDGSVSYDVQATVNSSGGAWNLTTYGTRFFQLAKMVGMGGMQLETNGGGINPFLPVPQAGAWTGPIIDQGWGWD